MYVYLLWKEVHDPYDYEHEWTQELLEVYSREEDADHRRLDLEHEIELEGDDGYDYEVNFYIESHELR